MSERRPSPGGARRADRSPERRRTGSGAAAAGGARRAAARRRRPGRAVLLVVLLVAVVAGGVAATAQVLRPGEGAPAADRSTTPTPGASTQAPTDPADGAGTDGAGAQSGPAAPPPRPEAGACYRLTYAEAVAATTEEPPSACGSRHTARTVAVGTLPLLVGGHLLAVDSARASAVPAARCPDLVADHLGGSRDDLRLSMLRAVWFSPTLEQAAAGADWFRCDVVAVAGDEELAPLADATRGLLARPRAAAYAVCGTAEPGTSGFERVVCARPHAWRAVSVVELDGRRYPGEAAVRRAGQEPCEAVGREEAADPLSFRWGWEWPTREEWDRGVTWGLCWVPDPA